MVRLAYPYAEASGSRSNNLIRESICQSRSMEGILARVPTGVRRVETALMTPSLTRFLKPPGELSDRENFQSVSKSLDGIRV